MASRTITTLIDDLDGGGADETVVFSLQGTDYEIDLSKTNVKKLVRAMQPYTTVARRTGGRPASKRSSSGGRDPHQLAKIRSWVRSNGHKVSDRGRIKQSVLDAYNGAT